MDQLGRSGSDNYYFDEFLEKTMTPKERWKALLRGEKMDRVPCDYWGTGEVTDRLKRELNCETERALWERLGIDKLIHLGPIHPKALETEWHLQSLFSLWNVETVEIAQAGGSVYRESVNPPLALAGSVGEIDCFPWPRPADWDLSNIATEIDAWKDYPILCGSSEPFYLYCRLRGMEQALEDLISNPEIAEAILEHIFLIDEGLIRRILDAFSDRVDFVYLAEDLGTQESLLMSPKLWRKFLMPRMRKLIELVHSYRIKVFHHDDGAVRSLLPELLEAGIDILNPIQWRCLGMDRELLARDFGEKVIFHGGVDNQLTLPFGTARQVREEVHDNLRIFKDCRYVVAPCHNIQPNTPTENILALYETVHELL
jgi:uroporphyrinogen decarboxylase